MKNDKSCGWHGFEVLLVNIGLCWVHEERMQPGSLCLTAASVLIRRVLGGARVVVVSTPNIFQCGARTISATDCEPTAAATIHVHSDLMLITVVS